MKTMKKKELGLFLCNIKMRHRKKKKQSNRVIIERKSLLIFLNHLWMVRFLTETRIYKSMTSDLT